MPNRGRYRPTPRTVYGNTQTPGGGKHSGGSVGGGAKEVNQKHSGLGPLSLNIGLIVGIAAGVLLLLLILAYALYKYKSRDEGSYKIDESKNYPYESPIAKPSPTANGGLSKSGMQPTSKPAKKKDVKEWYVWPSACAELCDFVITFRKTTCWHQFNCVHMWNAITNASMVLKVFKIIIWYTVCCLIASHRKDNSSNWLSPSFHDMYSGCVDVSYWPSKDHVIHFQEPITAHFRFVSGSSVQ